LYQAKSLDDTKCLAEKVSLKLARGSLVALYGELGAGKTTFSKTIISCLTDLPYETITSPTFNYMNLYSTKTGEILSHFDLYRLKTAEDFLLAGFNEYLGAPYITLIEWPDKISHLLPLPYQKITISHTMDQARTFEIEDIWQ
jgi:tRNA threonylcarbamoyladenosine biosynthesis protein TsaE